MADIKNPLIVMTPDNEDYELKSNKTQNLSDTTLTTDNYPSAPAVKAYAEDRYRTNHHRKSDMPWISNMVAQTDIAWSDDNHMIVTLTFTGFSPGTYYIPVNFVGTPFETKAGRMRGTYYYATFGGGTTVPGAFDGSFSASETQRTIGVVLNGTGPLSGIGSFVIANS